jgi:uncharacterized protein (TIGR02246 family)
MSEVEVISNGTNISQEDKEAVLQLPVEIDRTWNERNAHAYAALFDADGDFRFHNGQWIKGRKAIEQYWGEGVFPTLPKGMRHISTPRSGRFVTDEVAIGEGTIRLVEQVDGRERVHLEAECTLLAVKKNARWYISAVRLAALAPE